MSGSIVATDPRRMGLTRVRDLAAVAIVGGFVGYLVVGVAYGSLPPFPRLGGLVAALLGIAEAVFGRGLRSRIMADRSLRDRPVPPPVPLTAARAVMTAKATSLAGSLLGGGWIGVFVHLYPKTGMLAAARADAVTAALGVAGALMMVAGALFLEHCCRAPEDPAGRL